MKRHRISIVKRVSILGLLVGLLYLCLQTIVYNIYGIVPLDNHSNDSNKTSDIHLELVPVVTKDLAETQNLNQNDSDYIDWHDYEKIEMESKRIGPGEQGRAVVLSDEEMAKDKMTFTNDGFSGVSSDKMSLDRSVNDLRPNGCKSKKYLKNLPQVSVIIIFFDEYWTTLLRTVHSIVNRSPKSLLKEIILVDDFSSRDYLKQKLEDYMKNNYGDLVRIFRNSKREGLIRTKLNGARASMSDVLVFLESHVEVSVNWLPPLIEPIAKNNRTCTCPTLDLIKNENFQMELQDGGARGGFDWRLDYKRFPRLKYSLEHPTEPFASPVMSGGLFAIGRIFFWELGGYDAGLDIWGEEQYELSFKIWQCHGEMVDVPCSRIGHVYRGERKMASIQTYGDYISRNMKRVAVVWMDEYAEYVYQRQPSVRNIDPGNVTEMVELRKRLQCKPFKWFMEEIAFDIIPKYPTIELPPYASGQIRNKNSNMCIQDDASSDGYLKMATCLEKIPRNQRFDFTYHFDVQNFGARKKCLDANWGTKLIMFSCHGQGGNQCWRYHPDSEQIRSCSAGLCIDDTGSSIISNVCNSNDSQKWLLGEFSREAYNVIINRNVNITRS